MNYTNDNIRYSAHYKFNTQRIYLRNLGKINPKNQCHEKRK